MRITHSVRRLAALSTLAFLIAAHAFSPALAQNNQQVPNNLGPRANNAPVQGQGKGPSAEVVASIGSWKVQCETLPANPQANAGDPPQAGQRTCGMVQGAQNDETAKAQLTLVIVKSKQGDKTTTMMRVMAPIGVFLPTGVALEIDGNAVGRVPFTRCMPQICMAFAEASPETLTKLKKGKEANFIIYEAPGIGLPMKMKLDGFTQALAALDKQQ